MALASSRFILTLDRGASASIGDHVMSHGVPDPKRDEGEALLQQGKPVAEVARLMERPPSTVRYWKQQLTAPPEERRQRRPVNSPAQTSQDDGRPRIDTSPPSPTVA